MAQWILVPQTTKTYGIGQSSMTKTFGLRMDKQSRMLACVFLALSIANHTTSLKKSIQTTKPGNSMYISSASPLLSFTVSFQNATGPTSASSFVVFKLCLSTASTSKPRASLCPPLFLGLQIRTHLLPTEARPAPLHSPMCPSSPPSRN